MSLNNINDINNVPNNENNEQIVDNSYKTIKRKQKIFSNERQEMLNTIFGIIGINEENKIFYSHNISENAEMQQQILNLIPNLKMYYATSGWATFKTTIDVENKALSIIRALMREHNIEYTSKPIKVRVGAKLISSTMYEIQNY